MAEERGRRQIMRRDGRWGDDLRDFEVLLYLFEMVQRSLESRADFREKSIVLTLKSPVCLLRRSFTPWNLLPSP